VTSKIPARRRRHGYSAELVDLICERLVDGQSLRQICEDKNMPARSTLFVWLQKHKRFAREYTLAKWFQIECLLDDMLDMANDRSSDWVEREGPDGKKFRVFNPENLRRSELQIATHHWRISKLMLKRYRWK
jgi:hypothetical protein